MAGKLTFILTDGFFKNDQSAVGYVAKKAIMTRTLVQAIKTE